MKTEFFYSSSPAGPHRIAYDEYGPPDGPVVICVQGLTRNKRDFQKLAEALAAQGRRVICPDVAGRGESDWLKDPKLYDYPQYVKDMKELIKHVGAKSVDWVGTSMGGLIGIMLAAEPASPVKSMVLNDIGPIVPAPILQAIGQYVSFYPSFRDIDEAKAYQKQFHGSFGIKAEADWDSLTLNSVVPKDGGGYRLNYDPAIAVPYQQLPMSDLNLWKEWESLDIPVKVLRGAASPILSPDTVAKMKATGRQVSSQEISGAGHAPVLMDPAQIESVSSFLSGVSPVVPRPAPVSPGPPNFPGNVSSRPTY